MDYTPYSPYIKDRQTLDDGFSKGWGFHFPPSEEYVIDCHTHCRIPSGKKGDIIDALDRWFFYTEAYRQQKRVALVAEKEQFATYRDVAAEDSRLHWMFWPAVDEPDLAAVKQAYEMGACGLKLHNHRIMKGEVPFDIWYSPAWQEIFAFLNEKKMPEEVLRRRNRRLPPHLQRRLHPRGIIIDICRKFCYNNSREPPRCGG